MPELPEVEVVCRGLQPLLIGQTFTQVRSSGHALRRPLPEEALRRWLIGARVAELRRRGKYLIVGLDNQALLIFHLGMTGRLGVFPHQAPLLAHDHLGLRLRGGMELRFNDTRRFGLIEVLSPAEDEARYFAALGPEPLGAAFSVDYLAAKGARRTQAVKNLLMDSRQVVGIGNIYASEILHEAAVSPLRPCCQVSVAEWGAIVTQTKAVLTRAIAAGGSTIADFVNASGQPGYFQLELKVYGRAGSPCPRCGAVIAKEVLAGRSTFRCPRCQR